MKCNAITALQMHLVSSTFAAHCCGLAKKKEEKEESDDGHNGFLNLQQQTTR